MPAVHCAEYERLQENMREALQSLSDLTAAQLQAFRSHDHRAFTRCSEEFDAVFRDADRAIAALRRHLSEHRCRLASASAPE